MAPAVLPAPDIAAAPRDALAVVVYDDVLPDPSALRAQVLAGGFASVPYGGAIFHGIQRCSDSALERWLVQTDPTRQPTLAFYRQSPQGQIEPNAVHTDADMGDWTAVLYLTPDPPPGDGTTFLRHVATDRIASARHDEQRLWRTDRFEPWHHVPAQFNRVVVFPSTYFHTRSLVDNYGDGDTARLTQVVFGRTAPNWFTAQAPLPTGIRPATLADLPRLVEMGVAFLRSSTYAAIFPEDPARIAAVMGAFITDADKRALVATSGDRVVGLILACVYDQPWSGERSVGEFCWWVDPDARGIGLRLLRAIEQWAQQEHAVVIQLAAPTPAVEQLYTRLGYVPVERHFQKRFA